LIQRQEVHAIHPGTIVLFARDGRLIAHRVVSRTNDPDNSFFVTRGDSLSSPDSPIPSSEVLGRIKLIFQGGEWIKPSATPSFRTRLVAKLLSHSVWGTKLLVRTRAMGRPQRDAEVVCPSQ
jgi:hypothetical protein